MHTRPTAVSVKVALRARADRTTAPMPRCGTRHTCHTRHTAGRQSRQARGQASGDEAGHTRHRAATAWQCGGGAALEIIVVIRAKVRHTPPLASWIGPHNLGRRAPTTRAHHAAAAGAWSSWLPLGASQHHPHPHLSSLPAAPFSHRGRISCTLWQAPWRRVAGSALTMVDRRGPVAGLCASRGFLPLPFIQQACKLKTRNEHRGFIRQVKRRRRSA